MSNRRRAKRADRPRASLPSQAETAAVASTPDGSALWLTSIVVAVAAFVIYLITLAPTVATGESGELSTVAATLGLAHPPGYPTFTVLGHLFTLLPFGDPAYRVNLMSAVLGASAVFVACVTIGRWIAVARRESEADVGPRPIVWIAVAVGGLSLAVSAAFWRYSLVAEVFSLNNLLALLLLLLMLEWSRRPERPGALWAAAFIAGLALTNQQTIVFVAPSLFVLLAIGLVRYGAPTAKRGRTRPIPWLALGVAVLLGLAGLLPYLYLPLAAANGAATPWGDPTTIGGLVAIVSRAAYGTLSFTVRDTSGSGLEHLGLFASYLVTAFSPVGIALALVGGAWLVVRRPGEGLAVVLWLLIAGPVLLLVANPPLTDPVTRGVLERFYIMPSLVVALVIGLGTWQLATWLSHQERIARPLRSRIAVVAAVAVLAAPLVLAIVRWPAVDESPNRVASTYAEDILRPLPENALLLMRSDENYTSVTYAQEVGGLRPDVIAMDVELLNLDAYVDLMESRHPEIRLPFDRYDGGATTLLGDLIEQEIDRRPIYLIGPIDEDLSARFDRLGVGLTHRVMRDGEAPDPLADLREDPGTFDRLHPPARTYAETSWEAAIAATYGDVAFRVGVALQSLGPQPDFAVVERFYREAIRLSPTLDSAYKNLGLLLRTNGRPPSEIIPLWERYLELRPDDPQASAIRGVIEQLRGEASPIP